MNVLEKILEEIEEMRDIMKSPVATDCFGKECESGDCTVCVCERAMDIIRSHMDKITNMTGKRLIDANALDDEVMNFFLAITGNPKQATVVRECKESFRRMIDEQPTIYADDGWIPISERLPEPYKLVEVTVYCSEWISNYDSVWVSENEKIHHDEEYLVGIGCMDKDGYWIFYDQDGNEIYCDKELGSNKGNLYIVVTAWQPLPEPYKGNR